MQVQNDKRIKIAHYFFRRKVTSVSSDSFIRNWTAEKWPEHTARVKACDNSFFRGYDIFQMQANI